jgi:PAS domain S-box-containing protein
VATLEAQVAELQAGQRRAALQEQELRAHLDRLRAILKAVPVWVSFIDRDQRYRFNNWAVGEAVSDATEDVTGRLVSEVLAPDVYREMRPDLERALAGEPVTHDRSEGLSVGLTLPLKVSYTPCFGASGSVDGVVVVVGQARDFKASSGASRAGGVTRRGGQ